MKPTTDNSAASNPSSKLEAALVDPTYLEHQEMIGFLLKNKGKNLFPSKDLAEQKRLCKAKMERLAAQKSGLLLKDALSEILKDLPANFPSEQLQPLTKYLIQTWMKARQVGLVRT